MWSGPRAIFTLRNKKAYYSKESKSNGTKTWWLAEDLVSEVDGDVIVVKLELKPTSWTKFSNHKVKFKKGETTANPRICSEYNNRKLKARKRIAIWKFKWSIFYVWEATIYALYDQIKEQN